MTNEIIEPMRVLHIVGSMGKGGIQSFLMNLYRNIDSNQVQFDFFIHIPDDDGYEDEIRSLGGVIYSHQMPGVSSVLEYIRRIREFLEEHTEYQLIHIHLRTVASIWTLVARKERRISIVHSHSTTNGYGMSAYIKDIIQYPVRWLADYFMGCSTVANEWMFGEKIAHGDHCWVLNNGIEVERFKFNEHKREQIRKELGISSDTIVLGNVGRLVEQKNQRLLIDVIKRLIETDAEHKYHLVIVGDGVLRSELEKRIEELNIKGRVTMLGSRPDVNELLSAFDIFLMPSRNEGLGIAAIEAQASGLKVLCSDAVPDDALITEKCRRVSSNDPEKWVESVKKMLDEDNVRSGSGNNTENKIENEDENKIENDRGIDNGKIIEAGYDIKNVAGGW